MKRPDDNICQCFYAHKIYYFRSSSAKLHSPPQDGQTEEISAMCRKILSRSSFPVQASRKVALFQPDGRFISTLTTRQLRASRSTPQPDEIPLPDLSLLLPNHALRLTAKECRTRTIQRLPQADEIIYTGSLASKLSVLGPTLDFKTTEFQLQSEWRIRRLRYNTAPLIR